MSAPTNEVFPVFRIPLKTALKICTFVVLIALISMQCVYFLGIEIPSTFFSEDSNERINKKIKVKTILYWTKMWDDKTFYYGNGDIFRSCEVTACRATHDRNFTKIEDFDAILFHGIQIKTSDLPPARSPKQKYVFVDLESPVTKPLNSASILNGFYNWTMTYRRDSNIPRTYGYVVDSITNDVLYPIWARTGKHKAYKNLRSLENNSTFTGKQKPIAWFVSHCKTAGLRDNYVADLQKYIDVDIYGKCGPLRCPTSDTGCYKMLESRYYFYLSFENSLCQDYVTEKLYKVMAYNVVPIVYGAANYTEFAPPDSYINVRDFDSPEHLAKYLQHLMSNPQEYAKFFWWKKHFFIASSLTATACQMCKMLHDEESLASSSVSDLQKWWSKERCINPAVFLKKITRY